ncbi:MAG: type I methionyl aminopeptidase [Lachnospiraceae bacterium]|jgi:methionyl aminopeptidase|nr:type I methionyl aminopeptidase [Lachnospiraceae bacterium]
MAVTIKSPREIALMRVSGQVLANVFLELEQMIRPGISTKDIDEHAARLIAANDCKASFLNYKGFPASICTSVNEEVVHGIPDRRRVLQAGDIVSIDIGVNYKGFHTDAARTFAVGQVKSEVLALIAATKEAFYIGLRHARQGSHVHDISRAVDEFVTAKGYGIVRDLVGHGIGREIHEDPQIPHFTQRRRGLKLRPGMTICIEPMVNIGYAEVEWLDDGWTVVSEDRSWSAHYENTVVITDGEPELLTVVK